MNDVLNKVKNGNPGLMVGVAVLAIALIFGIWWIAQPRYEVLFDKTTDKERASILSALSEWQIPYRMDAKTGAFEVDATQVDDVRGRLASAGMVYETAKGYELFDKADYGLSEFAQRINYQRALEGELARSIMSLMPVKHARVHLTLQKNSLFSAQQQVAKASILLQLKPQQQLTQSQVAGIREMVAAAVEGLSSNNVAVMNEQGLPLTADEMESAGSLATNLENALQAKAILLIGSVLGDAAATVSVSIDKNQDKVKSVKDELLPLAGQSAGAILRKRENRSALPSAEKDQTSNDSTSQVETEFAYSRQRFETEHAVGKVQRVNVGVVVDYPLTDYLEQQLSTLLSAGLGLDTARGDRLSIVAKAVVSDHVNVHSATDDPTSTSASVRHEITEDRTETESDLPGNTVKAIYGVAVLLVVVLIVGGVLLARRRMVAMRYEPRRLSEQEREKLLLDARKWLSTEA